MHLTAYKGRPWKNSLIVQLRGFCTLWVANSEPSLLSHCLVEERGWVQRYCSRRLVWKDLVKLRLAKPVFVVSKFSNMTGKEWSLRVYKHFLLWCKFSTSLIWLIPKKVVDSSFVLCTSSQKIWSRGQSNEPSRAVGWFNPVKESCLPFLSTIVFCISGGLRLAGAVPEGPPTLYHCYPMPLRPRQGGTYHRSAAPWASMWYHDRPT